MDAKRTPLTVYLVRHAHPVPPGTAACEENDRPLSTRGVADAERLVSEFDSIRISALYSSPYPRARQTIEPIARRLKLGIEIVDDLRERLLASPPLLDWREHLKRSWLDFDYTPDGGESSRGAQRRVVAVLDQIRARHADGERVILASHGNLIALALNAFDASIDFDFWEAIPLPAVYRLEHAPSGWHIVQR